MKQNGVKGSDVSDWGSKETAKEFNLENGKKIELTAANRMEIRALYNRGTQAITHMIHGGIRVKGGKSPVALTLGDIDSIMKSPHNGAKKHGRWYVRVYV